MSKRISLNVESNLGYGPDQIKTSLTLAELLEAVQEAVTEWGEDAEVVLYQTNNGYGANYGRLNRYELFDATDSYDSVTCDECDATSESGWGDAGTCLDCTPSEDICARHDRTLVGSCPLCENE